MITSREFVEKNPNTVRAFLRAFNRSLKGTIENPRDALATLKPRDALVDIEVEGRRLVPSSPARHMSRLRHLANQVGA